MISRSAVRKSGRQMRRAMACGALACALVASMMPFQAHAYYNRGSVTVDLGTTSVEVQAGATATVTVSISPASDEQTQGCGMPLCPQGCSPSCADENGQCTCAGTEYQTYYPTATATSSNSGVATASYDDGVLTVYGRSQGEATITVTASLRQFTDDSTTLTVRVEGEAEGYQAGSDAYVEAPEAAEAIPDDRLDLIEKTVMGRPIHNVRIGEGCDPQARLAEMAGIDGDVIFWSGDTYYQPDYSLTFKGVDYSAEDVVPIDVNLDVTTEAEGTLNQPLAGLSDFVVVDFNQKGALFAPVEVYAFAEGVLMDDDVVSLYSYDASSKSFVKEDSEADVVGGYVKFTVQEGKSYVVSSRDMTVEANAAVNATSETGQSSMESQPPLAGIVIAAAIAVVAIVAVVAVKRRGRAAKESPVDGDADSDSSGE